MGLTIGELAANVELFHLETIRAERPAPVRRHALDQPIEWRIEPSDGAIVEHRGAIFGIDERTASSRDDNLTNRQ